MRKMFCDSAMWGGGRTATLLLLLFLLTNPASAKSKKLSPDLPAASGKHVDVIVQFKQAGTATNFAKVQQRGGAFKRDLRLVKAAAFRVPADALAALADDPDVAYISPDRPLSGSLDTATATVGADIARTTGFDGTGVGVAVIDSGVNATSDLNTGGGTRVVYSENFVPGSTSTQDAYGHGNHVAVIIAGNGSSSNCRDCFRTFFGMAPKANIINLRVLDENGRGSDSAVIAAIQRAIQLKSQYNIRVINLSLGRGVFESYTQDPLCQAVEQAWQAGIVVVTAAGNYGRDNSNANSGYATITAPGNDPYVITVGAMKAMETPLREDDQIATYSSKGPTLLDHVVKPDLVAPGNRIISGVSSSTATLFKLYTATVGVTKGYYKTGPGSKDWSPAYFRLSGTSMATPMVSGAAALLLQKDPTLTPDQVKARLMKTAWKNFPASTTTIDPETGITYNEQYDIFTVGAGYLDVTAALQNFDSIPANSGIAKSPFAVYNASNGQVYLVTDSSVLWGSSVMWGTSVIWGSTILRTDLNGQSVLWGSSVMWGTNTSAGFSVIWGADARPMSVLWGTSAEGNGALSVLVNGEQ